MARWIITFGAVAAAATLATLGIAGTFTPPKANSTAITTQARRVAVDFFRSQNERRYADTCRLLARGFIRSHALRDRRTCSAVMRVVFVWNGKIDFRIGHVTHEHDRVVVHAVADGAPGRLVLVRQDGASPDPGRTGGLVIRSSICHPCLEQCERALTSPLSHRYRSGRRGSDGQSGPGGRGA